MGFLDLGHRYHGSRKTHDTEGPLDEKKQRLRFVHLHPLHDADFCQTHGEEVIGRSSRGDFHVPATSELFVQLGVLDGRREPFACREVRVVHQISDGLVAAVPVEARDLFEVDDSEGMVPSAEPLNLMKNFSPRKIPAVDGEVVERPTPFGVLRKDAR